MKTSSGLATPSYSKRAKAFMGGLLVGSLAVSFWIWTTWTHRAAQPAYTQRNSIWMIESPTTANATSFVRVQDTSFWAERQIGVITSNSYVSTTSRGARLTNSSQGSDVRVSPDSTVLVDRHIVKAVSGLIQVRGPVALEVSTENKNESLKIPSGETRVVWGQKTVEAMEPAIGSIRDLQVSGRIDFAWANLKNREAVSAGARLEFSRDSAFKTVLFSLPTQTATSLAADFSDRSPGTWFARLIDGDRTIAVTSIQLVESQTPDQLRRLGRRWLSWRDRGEAALYRVDFASDQTFKNVAHSFQVRQRQLDLTLVPAGPHYVRVSSVSLDGTESASRPLAIEVQDKTEILRAGTELNDPDLKLLARGWKIHLNEDEMSRLREGYVILRESELRGIRIADTVTPGQIIFEVARDENFSNPERVKPDPQGELLPPALPLGVLFARLRRIDQDGHLGATGPASKLTTLLPSPKPLALATTRLKNAEGDDVRGVEIRWSLKAPVAGYELRVSTDAEFSETATRVMRTREASRKIAAPGLKKFYWTVTAINHLGQPISLTSKAQEAKVPEPPRLKTTAKVSEAPTQRAPAMVKPLRPELTGPLDDAVIVAGARAKTYGQLSWNFDSKKTKDQFEVQIATDGDFVNVIEKKKVKASEYTLRGDLPEGSLFWRVRKEPSKEWSRSRRFELVYE